MTQSTTTPKTPWQPFSYHSFTHDMYWLRAVSPDMDVDMDDDGSLVGAHTGLEDIAYHLSWVTKGDDALPEFDAVDSANFGSVSDDGMVTHFAPVVAPEFVKGSEAWTAFHYRDFEPGLYWLRVVSFAEDGTESARFVMAWVDETNEGEPDFDSVNTGKFGRIYNEDNVKHIADVVAPAFL